MISKGNNTGISIVIACCCSRNLIERVRLFLSQVWVNCEFVIGYVDDALNLEDIKLIQCIMQKHKINVSFVKCIKPLGKYETDLSKNEIYIQCEQYITKDYVVLTTDMVDYSKDYFKIQKRLENLESDIIINGYNIAWNNGTQALYPPYYETNDNPNECNTNFIFTSPNRWWLICTENKIFKKELIKKCLKTLSEYYKHSSAHLELDELMLSVVSFKYSRKISIDCNNYIMTEWKDSDEAIKNFYENATIEYYMNEIEKVSEFIKNKVIGNHSDKFEYFFNFFLGRVIWRHEWAIPSIKDRLKQNYPGIKSFSIDSFCKYEVNISELDAVSNNENIDDIKVKVYVSMHNESYIPRNSQVIEPIQVGTSLSKNVYSNMIHDNDSVDNISEKNKMYCELTSQYYVWKNIKNQDYYGFWHYRRYFSFNKNESNNDNEIIYLNSLNDESIKKSNIDDNTIKEYCAKYDIILPRKTLLRENGEVITVYQQWCNHFNKKDLDVTIDVVSEKYPQYLKAFLEVMNSTSAVFCNMFIMAREYFNQYSQFCFDILFEVEQRIDQERYNIEKYRTLGHIAERLLAVYVTYIEKYSKEYARIFYALKIQYNDTKPYAIIEHPQINNCVSIMLACDDKYMRYTNVLLESIKENSSKEYYYDIVICHRDITLKNQNISESMFNNCKNISIRFADVTRNFEKFTKLHIDRHLSLETYYRFLVLDIFKGYDRVLYLDCDMVVNSDLSELFFTEMTDQQYIAAVRDYDFIAAALSKDKEFYHEKILKHVKIDKPENYFQAGMILFNLKNLLKQFSSDSFFETALSRNWFFHDQDVLNCLLNGHVKFVDDKWNVFSLLEENSRRSDLLFNHLPAKFSNSYQKSLRNPAIVHYAGVPKVWFDSSIHLGHLFWKYARNTPFYEKLNDVLNNGEGDKSGWLLFTSPNSDGQKTTHFFSIRSVNDPWISNYCVIDFIFMSNHTNIITNTLIVNYSLFPHEKYGVWTKVIDFKWTNSSEPFNQITYCIDDNKSHGLDIYVTHLNQYEGFSFKVRQLSSRCNTNPYIKIERCGFVP